MTTTPPAPTPTAYTDASPCPRVEVLISPMPVDADTVTVWRSYDGGNRAVVRGANSASVSGDFLVVDYWAPFGVEVTYYCQSADVDGVPSTTSDASTAVTLDVADVWLSDPLDPGSSLMVPMTGQPGLRLSDEAFTTVNFPLTVTTAEVIGQSVPLGFAGTRQAATSTVLDLLSPSKTESDALKALLDQAYPVCVRVPLSVADIDPLVYASIDTLTRARLGYSGVTRWTMGVTSVREPGVSVVIAVRTYADLDSEAATYADLATRYATYLDAQRGT